jgi:uncharacterized integral membrane protein
MIALILFFVFGLIFGYFATLNTTVVSLFFAPSMPIDAPLYLIVLACLCLGVLFAGIFAFVKSLSTKLAFSKKEGELTGLKKDIAELTKKNHQLELENTKLKVRTGEETTDDDSL